MKETLAIIAFASLTAVPPVIAGLHAAPAPQAESAVSSGPDNDFFSLSGAFCSARPSGKPSSGRNITYVRERAPSGGEKATETDSFGEVAK